MRRATGILVCLALAVSAAASGQATKADPARVRVEKLGKDFTEAFNRGDVAAVAGIYAEDAIAFPPDSDLVRGRTAIQAVWQGFRDIGGKSMEFTVIDVDASGNLIVETGQATLKVQPAGAAEATVAVKYVVVWKKQKDGSWKITRDIWNSMAPAAPAAATSPTPPPHH